MLAQLDRVIARVEAGQDVVRHDTLIKPRWRKDPFAWARERLKLPMKAWGRYAPGRYFGREWDGTREPLLTCARELGAGNNVAVASATGIGKTFLGAVLVLWFLDCWEGSQVVTLAPKQDQLTLHIWKEIGRLLPLFKKVHPRAELSNLRLRMRPNAAAAGTDALADAVGWGAVGFPCGVAADETVANRARGFHAEHMLFIVEETTGVDDSILAAIELTCTSPHNLRLFFGNPDSELDSLAKVAREPGVVSIRASALDHPNVVADDHMLIPGAASMKRVLEMKAKYGEDDQIYRSRVRGIAPSEAFDSLIRREWLVTCSTFSTEKIQELMAKGENALGVDVANSEEGDKASITYGRGAVTIEVKSQQCPDVNAYARQHVYPYISGGMVRGRRVGLDSVGIGVGAINELKRLGTPITALNGGEAMWTAFADDGETFLNLRAQMYWQARKDLSQGRVAVPADEELWGDLLVVKWTTRNKNIVIEAKEKLKERLRRSPDKGDSWIYWNWIRQAARAPSFGAGESTSSGSAATV